MSSIFDAPVFNERLFFPREDAAPCPPTAEDHWIPVPEGRLHLRWHPAPGARFALLHFHGNGEIVADYDGLAPAFADLGVELLAVDYRGYGLSEGLPTFRALMADARSAALWLRGRTQKPYGVYGRSLGSACVAELMGDPPPGLAFGIWESGFSDLGGLVARRGLAVPPTFSEAEIQAFDPLPKLARGTLPFLALHGEADHHLSPEESRRAFEASGSPFKTFISVPGRGHEDLPLAPALWQALGAFFTQLASEPRPSAS